MKIIAIFGDGSNQKALANRLHNAVPLAHIAKVTLAPKGRRRIIRSAVSLTLARSLRSAWRTIGRYYDEQFPRWPDVAQTTHPSANHSNLISLVEELNPDLVLVSGTDLLRRATLERFATRTMNLHTGISPYIKGGPNCTNWALALGEFDLIGNTVMWIDPGIDTGAIIATERTPLTGTESLPSLHIKVMDHAHDLYTRAVSAFALGERLPAVPQSELGEGRLFYSRDWNSWAMLRAAFNHRFRYRSFSGRSEIAMVALR